MVLVMRVAEVVVLLVVVVLLLLLRSGTRRADAPLARRSRSSPGPLPVQVRATALLGYVC